VIFGRRRSLHARLVATHAALMVLALGAALATLVVWFYHFELGEFISSLSVEAEMVATSSKAAVLFEDKAVLNENLAVLRHEPAFRWAVMTGGGKVLASLGTIPSDVDRIRSRMDHDVFLEAFRRIVIRRTVTQDDKVIGELLVAADLSENNQQLGYIVLAMIFTMVGGVLIGLPLFYRTVGAISRPLAELARLSQLVSSRGDEGERMIAASEDEIGRMGTSFNRMLDSLAQRDVELRRSRDRLRELNDRQETIREDERTRIAREVHDELGQRLTALKLEAFRIIGGNGAIDEAELSSLRVMFDQTVRIVREIAWELRPSVLDTLGLAAGIEWLGEDFQRRSATRCLVTLPDSALEVAPDVATHLFRICQELLTNVARHAEASRVNISLSFVADTLNLEVADNGVGLRPGVLESASLGLLGIRERVRRMGATMDIETKPVFQGTRIRIAVPIPRR
jgi:signal transduction histidine kinase